MEANYNSAKALVVAALGADQVAVAERSVHSGVGRDAGEKCMLDLEDEPAEGMGRFDHVGSRILPAS